MTLTNRLCILPSYQEFGASSNRGTSRGQCTFMCVYYPFCWSWENRGHWEFKAVEGFPCCGFACILWQFLWLHRAVIGHHVGKEISATHFQSSYFSCKLHMFIAVLILCPFKNILQNGNCKRTNFNTAAYYGTSEKLLELVRPGIVAHPYTRG